MEDEEKDQKRGESGFSTSAVLGPSRATLDNFEEVYPAQAE